MDQLLALVGCVSQLLGRTDALAATLQASAASARKAGQPLLAEAALGRLTQLLRRQAAAPGGAAAATAPGGSGHAGWLARMLQPGAPWLVENAKLMWRQGQHMLAIRELQGLIQQQTSLLAHTPAGPVKGAAAQADELQAGAAALVRTLALAGKWAAQSQQDVGASGVMALMAQAVDVVKGAHELGNAPLPPSPEACRAFYRLAVFADQRYVAVDGRMCAQEWRIQQAVLAAKRSEMRTLQARLAEPGHSELVRRYITGAIGRLAKVVAADEEANAQLVEAKRTSLHVALDNYVRTLTSGDGYDLQVVYRLCQLWFDLPQEEVVNRTLAAAFDQVPSYKFVPLVYQIASRMGAAPSGGSRPLDFQCVLGAALERLAIDHPFHCLYSVLALRNGNLGPNGMPVPDGGSTAVMRQEADTDKVQAAAQLLARLARHPARGEVFRQMESLVMAYVQLAAQKPPEAAKQAEGMAFPAALRRRMQDAKLVPVPSINLPVDPTCCYDDAPTIAEMRPRIRFAGGINAPKVVVCVDAAGHRHRQLVKSGNDDLRQDAVMQQFFGLVNQLLAASQAAARRRLSMGVYRVVPFSPCAGLVEWVENTLPMMEYLTGPTRTGGAHARYKQPGDLTWLDCHRQMAAAQPQQLRARYDAVCRRFPPVLHHFFLEAFRSPPAWFEARTSYARSTAVSSMAGHVIGLGDRHLGNILLDLGSARVVHIDLGVAFEQGKMLQTPEQVPFRLTRDVVDGMGAAGVEGPFRRCCEETLQVLRANKDAILTVVGVVLHDPLYRWRMTPVRARHRQQEQEAADEQQQEQAAAAGGRGRRAGSGGSGAAAAAVADVGSGDSGAGGERLGNADAERAVLRVRQKLEGVEGGEGEPRNVASQVQGLLQEAKDPDRLCKMFVGWSAWL